MKISRDWLSDFVDWVETDPETIADRITRCMGEVDDVIEQGALLKECVVGRVESIGKHPNADKLSLCTVQTDRGVKKVVCGGTNVRKDMLVAFAHIGATVKWHGGELMTLAPVTIRGEKSEGMICAGEELGLESLFPAEKSQGERPIVDLTKTGAKVGTPLRKALGLSDVVFHIDNHAITNRPDLFSHIGVAREVVAMGLATWKKRPREKAIKFPSAAVPFKVINEVKDTVPYYEACMLQMGPSGPSPNWMQKRLLATGWRPINLMVDITNYVLMEIGMPLHAFDADDFRGDIHIRHAKKGESITTLDDVKRPLPEGAVIMSDKEGIFDLFAVMGGLRTSNKPTTKNVYLQAGLIEPRSVRRTTMQMAHRTDAATVYEKGVMPVTAAAGLRRAVELLTQLSPESRITSKILSWGKVSEQKAVKIEAKRIPGFIGMPITPAKTKKILTDLGCAVKGSGEVLSVTPPAWRRDIAHVQDVTEEVSRIFGYANVVPAMPEASIAPPARDHRIHRLRDALKEAGYSELLNLAFTSPQNIEKAGFQTKDAVEIENPIGEELSRMRPSLLPTMLDVVARETPKVEKGHLKVYEYGHVFAPGKEASEFVLIVAAKGKSALGEEPVLIAKADLKAGAKAAGYTITFRPTKESLPPFAHAGRSAEIVVQGKRVGLLTEVHPSIASAFDLPGRAAAAIVDMETVGSIAPEIVIAEPIAMFPSVTLDETLPLSKNAHAPLLERAKKVDPLLKSVVVADLYEGDGNRTITLRFTYRADDRTLTQGEVENIHTKVLAELKKV